MIELWGFMVHPAVFYLGYAILTGFNILDGYTTWQVLKPDKYHLELNPLARWIFRKLGMPNGIIITEAVWISFYTILLAFIATLSLLTTFILILLGILVFGWVAWDGFRIIRKSKHRSIPSK